MNSAINVKNLVQKATHITSYHPERNEPFWSSLERLVSAIHEEPDVHEVGRNRINQWLLTRLISRFAVAKYFKDHPEIVHTTVSKPIIIVSLPRTGTTLLHRLLSLDPYFRAPLFWELLTAAVPPPLPETHDQDPRKLEVAKAMNLGMEKFPKIRVVHPMDAEAPEECYPLLERGFTSLTCIMQGAFKSYFKWLCEAGLKDSPEVFDAYECHKRQLQLLQLHFPEKTWLLKAPTHQPFLRTLLKTYPDARIICLHRNPEFVIPSLCSLISMTQGFNHSRLDYQSIGMQILEIYSASNKSFFAARNEINDQNNFYDINYGDLIKNSLITIQSFYNYFEMPLPYDMNRKIEQYFIEDKQKNTEKHIYNIEEYNLKSEQIREAFHDYCEEFDL